MYKPHNVMQNKEVQCSAVEKNTTYPKAMAAAMARPIDADFPLPLAAVKVTVVRSVFSDIASINLSKDFA